MSINIQGRNDYSFLFSSLGTGSAKGSSNLNFLSDYSLIKSGSYGKLMKAYYGEMGKETGKDTVSKQPTISSKPVATEEEKKSYAKVQTSADALKESADKLLENGSNSVFAMKPVTTKDENGVETTKNEYDTKAIYDAVNSFVNDYNSVVNAVDDAGNEKITNRAVSMANGVAANERLLNKIGITMNEDSTLSIDKKAFESANMSTVKTLFSGNNSLAYRVSSQASMIDFAAGNEASKSSTYTYNGGLSTTYNSGTLFDSLF